MGFSNARLTQVKTLKIGFNIISSTAIFKFEKIIEIATGSIGHFNTIARLLSNNKISQCTSNDHFSGEFDVQYSLDLKFTKLDNKY